ncbi:MAG: anaerobic selenocysteine-containing dehydrogenase [Parasphingorhabdus sp.]|jgi:anaerobic selenocysteine-containing dehydrogenase
MKINGCCPHDCPDGCGVVTTVENGVAIEFAAQSSHPVAEGWLCAKVAPYLERVYHADRLKHPLRRVGAKGSGQWQRISWPEAIEEITSNWKQVSQQHGAEAILPYSYSGTLGLVQMAVSSARLWNRMGASRLDRSICMAATRHAVRSTLGARMSPPYHHVRDSKLIILWAHNPVSTAPHLMPHLRQARRDGCLIVAIDPQVSRSAKSADIHIKPLPGSDYALAYGIAYCLLFELGVSTEWLQNNTSGWSEYQNLVSHYDPQRVANLTGVTTDEIRKIAKLLATTKPSMIRMGDAVNRNRRGGQTVHSIAALQAITGQYGIRGGGMSCSTGDYFMWDDEAVNKWSECPAPGRMINMNQLGTVLSGNHTGPPIKSLFVFAANPMTSSPNTEEIRRGLCREDLFTVVHDLFMTDTAGYADIVLPATSQLEQVDLHRGYGHTYLSLNQQAIEPLHECKSNWDTMQLLATSMGFNEGWLQESPEQVIQGVIDATDSPRLSDNLWQELTQNGHVSFADVDEVPFSELHFPTPSGKVEMDAIPQELSLYTRAAETLDNKPNTDGEFIAECEPGLRMISPAAHHFVNSSLANLPTCDAKEKQPTAMLHPTDAHSHGLLNGSNIRLFNKYGWCVRQLRISDTVRQGVVVAHKGYWTNMYPNSGINRVTTDELADVAGQSSFNSTLVNVEAAQ